MIPRTFPSTINTDTGKRQMVVFFITSTTGLQRWKDYIPVAFVTDATPSEGSYNNDGYIAIDSLTSISNKQEWKDYVPVFLDSSATDAWRVSSVGMIPIGFSGLGGIPYALFASGEQGAWYDPSDLTTLFQNQAGTTPVTAVEQPVSLMLDKSKGGGSIGADTVVNGTFAADSDWTKGTGWAIGSGVATKTAGTASLLSQSATLIVGRSYLITYTITRTAGTLTGQLTGGTTVSGTARDAAGTYTDMLTAVSGNNAIAFSADASFAGTVDNVTLRLLPAGNHAYTPSTATASRPVLSARVNLLTKTEQFDDAAWTKVALNAFASGSVANTTLTTDPLGGNTADYIQENTESGTGHSTVQSISIVSGVIYTFSCYIKPAERTIGYLRLGGTPNLTAYFNLSNGTALTVSSGLTTAISNEGNGWYKYSITWTSTVTASQAFVVGMTTTDGTVAYTGDGTSGIYIWGADLRVSNDGVGIPSYQRVDTSTSYDTVGFPLYLRADGTDDYMLTNSIDFTATDKMTVWAGVRKLSDAAQGSIAEFNTSGGSGFGRWVLLGPSSAANNYQFSSVGTSGSNAVATTYSAPITNILCGFSEISQDVCVLRVDSVQVASGTSDQGTGNYGTYPIFIGRRAGLTNSFNGRIYGVIVRGAQSSTAQIEATETYLNQKTKAY
jgi:hypothetical protein